MKRRTVRVHSRSFAVLSLVLLIIVTVHAADEPKILTPDDPSTFQSLSRFAELIETLHKKYIDPARIDSRERTTVALRAFVRALDPEADLFGPDEIASTNAATDAVADIGLRFAMRSDYPVVISPRDDSPAQDAGLLAGEQILAIDHTSTLRVRRIELERLLRGPANSPVTLSVRDPVTRAGRDVRLQRTAPNPSPGVVLKFLDRRLAYCRLPEFTPAAVEALRTAMTRAKEERVSGVILDLRNNAGGVFEAMQVAASLFLPADAAIVALDYADPTQRATFVSDQGEKSTVPLVVLVNGGTAAEAEMFAAALQDHKRAQIVGARTFGRGFLTTSVTLADGSVLSVPGAYYLRPTKQPMQGTGLTPDIAVDMPRETERVLSHLGFSTFNWKTDKTAVLKTDRPLAKALWVLSK
jgi:carboxyl-terminal processing protease